MLISILTCNSRLALYSSFSY